MKLALKLLTFFLGMTLLSNIYALKRKIFPDENAFENFSNESFLEKSSECKDPDYTEKFPNHLNTKTEKSLSYEIKELNSIKLDLELQDGSDRYEYFFILRENE